MACIYSGTYNSCQNILGMCICVCVCSQTYCGYVSNLKQSKSVTQEWRIRTIWINLKLHRIWGLVPAVPRLYSAQEKNNFCLQHSCLIRSNQKLGYCLQLGYKWRGETIRFPSTFIARPSSGIEPMVWRQPNLTVRITCSVRLSCSQMGT